MSRYVSRQGRAATVVAVASGLANVLGYALSLVAARVLGPEGFGAYGALLAVVMVGNVPAIGLQTHTALEIARCPAADRRQRTARLLGLGTAVAVGTTVLAGLLALPLSSFLHLSSPAAPLWAAAGLLPMTLVAVFQGLLQGAERFHRLSLLFVAAAAGKVVGGLCGLAWLGTVEAAVAGSAGGALAAAVVGWVVAGGPRPAWTGVRHLGDAAHTVHALLALFVLTNLDVVLARHHLDATAAGLYAVGAVVTKACFWLPQFASVVALPALASPARRAGARRLALLTVGLVGLLATGVCAAAGDLVLRVVGGRAYEGGEVLWLFAALGSLFALVQVTVFARLADRDRRGAAVLWSAAVVQLLVTRLWLHDSVLDVLLAALLGVGLVLLLPLVLALRRGGGRPPRDTPAAAAVRSLEGTPR